MRLPTGWQRGQSFKECSLNEREQATRVAENEARGLMFAEFFAWA